LIKHGENDQRDFWGRDSEEVLGKAGGVPRCLRFLYLLYEKIHSPLPPPLVYGGFFIFLTNATARCLANDLRKNTLGKG